MTDIELIGRLQVLRANGAGPGGGDARDEFWDLVSQNVSRIVALASMWVDVVEVAKDGRVSSEGVGMRVRSSIND